MLSTCITAGNEPARHHPTEGQGADSRFAHRPQQPSWAQRTTRMMIRSGRCRTEPARESVREELLSDAPVS
jgi:hypothetical protein